MEFYFSMGENGRYTADHGPAQNTMKPLAGRKDGADTTTFIHQKGPLEPSFSFKCYFIYLITAYNTQEKEKKKKKKCRL